MFLSIDDQIVDYSTINVNSILFSCSFYDSVPPQKIRIIENSRQVSSVIGPYDEGDQLSLNCIVTGGIQLLVPYPNWTISVIGRTYDFIGNRSTTSRGELVVERQIGGPHLHWHVGGCRSKCPDDPATGATSSARCYSVSSVQLLWCPQ